MRQHRVGIVAFDNAEVLDVMGPFEVFSVASRISEPSMFEVNLVSDRTDCFLTLRHGLGIKTDYSIDDAPEFDLIIVAGGVTTEAEKNQDLLHWLQNRVSKVKNLASICTGAFILAQAGIITNQEVTTHWEDQAELSQRFPDLKVLSDRRWVGAGKIHTSGGISAGIDLSLHLVETLAGRDLAVRTARQMEYHWND